MVEVDRRETARQSGVAGFGRRVVRAESGSVLLAIVLFVLLIGALRPRFLGVGQLLDVLDNAVYVALHAAGMAFLLAMREIDLSVSATFGLSLIATALLWCTASRSRRSWRRWPPCSCTEGQPSRSATGSR